MHFAVGRNPLAVYVAPRVAAADRTVHVVVETDLFEPVVGLYSQAAEQVVPCVHLIPAYGFEIPAERFGDFGGEVLRGVFDADERDARTYLHDGIPHGIELHEQTCVFAGAAAELPDVVGDDVVLPAAHAEDRTVELDDEVQYVVLIGVVAPYARRELVARTLDAALSDPLHRDVFELDAVLGFGMQLDQDTARAAVCGEGETLEAAARCGRHFGLDAVVGQVGAVVADIGPLGAFVDARAVAFVGLLFVADAGFQLAVCGHDAQSSERPLVDMAETADILERGLVTGLPSRILVVGAHLDHAERHPRSRRDHPARVGRADARVHVIGRRLERLRRAYDAAPCYFTAVAKNPVSALFGFLHLRHRGFELVTARFDALVQYLFVVEFDAERGCAFEPFEIDQQGLDASFAVGQFIGSGLDVADEELLRLFHVRAGRAFEAHTVEKYPRAFQHGDRHLVAAGLEYAGTDRDFEPAGRRFGEVARDRQRIDDLLHLVGLALVGDAESRSVELELGVLRIDRNLDQRQEVFGVIEQIDDERAGSVGGNLFQSEEDIDLMRAPARRGPCAAPRVGRSGQDVGEIGGGNGVPDEEIFVFIAEIVGEEVAEAVRSQCEFGRRPVGLSHRPYNRRRLLRSRCRRGEKACCNSRKQCFSHGLDLLVD